MINFDRGVSKAGQDERLETASGGEVVECKGYLGTRYDKVLCEGQESKMREF